MEYRGGTVENLNPKEEGKGGDIVKEADEDMLALEEAMIDTGRDWRGGIGNPDQASLRDGVEYDFGGDGDHGDGDRKVETDGQAEVKIPVGKKKPVLRGFEGKRAVKLKSKKT